MAPGSRAQRPHPGHQCGANDNAIRVLGDRPRRLPVLDAKADQHRQAGALPQPPKVALHGGDVEVVGPGDAF